jgi:hypothetical protein
MAGEFLIAAIQELIPMLSGEIRCQEQHHLEVIGADLL